MPYSNQKFELINPRIVRARASALYLVTQIPPDVDGLEPRFGSRRLNVVEAIAERRNTMLYLWGHTLDSVSISVLNKTKSEPCSLYCSH